MELESISVWSGETDWVDVLFYFPEKYHKNPGCSYIVSIPGKADRQNTGRKERGMNTETFERLLKQAVPDGKRFGMIRIRTEKPVMYCWKAGKTSFFRMGPVERRKVMERKRWGRWR